MIPISSPGKPSDHATGFLGEHNYVVAAVLGELCRLKDEQLTLEQQTATEVEPLSAPLQQSRRCSQISSQVAAVQIRRY